MNESLAPPALFRVPTYPLSFSIASQTQFRALLMNGRCWKTDFVFNVPKEKFVGYDRDWNFNNYFLIYKEKKYE
jgi:hypothetical protein